MSSHDFDDVFREAGHYDARQTQCPSQDEIVAYREHRLPLDQRQYVRDHIRICGLCDVHLIRLNQPSQPATSPVRRFRQRLSHPALGWAAAVVVASLFFISRYQLQAKLPANGPHTVPIIQLTQAGEAGNSLAPTNSRFFILSFFVPRRSGFEYTALFTNTGGDALLPAIPLTTFGPDSYGYLACDRNALPAGVHKLRVNERSPKGVLERYFTYGLPAAKQ